MCFPEPSSAGDIIQYVALCGSLKLLVYCGTRVTSACHSSGVALQVL